MAHGGTLRLAYRSFAGFDRAFDRQIQAFRESRPGIEIHKQDFDLPALHSLMVSGRGCFSGDWDLFLCVSDWLPALMLERRLQPLNRFLEGTPPPDWPGGWGSSLVGAQRDGGGQIFGMPYHDGPEIFMYRADLFEDPKEQEAFRRRYSYSLRAPQTWSEFLDVAHFFTRPEDDVYGCVLAAQPDGHNSVYDFLIQLWSRGGRFLDGSRVAFHGPEGCAALQYLTDLIHKERVTQPEPLQYESVRSGECYASGLGAMMWNWSGFGVVADMPPSRIIGKSKYGLLPRGDQPGGRHVSLSVYWLLTIPAGCQDPEMAWDFMRFVASPEMDRVTSVEGGIGCRLSTWRDPQLQKQFPCYAQIEAAHDSAEILPQTPALDQVIDILNESIDQVHRHRKSVEGTLSRAAHQVEALLVE